MAALPSELCVYVEEYAQLCLGGQGRGASWQPLPDPREGEMGTGITFRCLPCQPILSAFGIMERGDVMFSVTRVPVCDNEL